MTKPADINLDKTVRTDTKTIWCVILEQSVWDQWDSQMHCAEITDGKESEYEAESEKGKTEIQIMKGTDRKCTIFTDHCGLLGLMGQDFSFQRAERDLSQKKKRNEKNTEKFRRSKWQNFGILCTENT